MVKNLTATINGKQYTAVFNLNTFRTFSKEKGLKYISDLQDIMGSDDTTGDISIDQLDNFGLLLHSAFKEGARIGRQDFDLTVDDMFVMFQDDSNIFGDMIRAIANDDNHSDISTEKKEKPSQTVKKKKVG